MNLSHVIKDFIKISENQMIQNFNNYVANYQNVEQQLNIPLKI